MKVQPQSDDDSGYSIAPVNPVQLLKGQESEWMRLPAPKARLWGLSRSTWIELIDSNKVKGVTLRKRHAVRGIRLIYRPSAEAYLMSLMPDASE